MIRAHHEPLGQQRRIRRHARKILNLGAEFSPVNIKENMPHNMGTILGLCKNLSPSGLYAELPVLYRVGTRFQVRVPLNGQTLSFYVIVWRVDPRQDAEKPDVYGHGMKITTASDETLQTISDFIGFTSAPS